MEEYIENDTVNIDNYKSKLILNDEVALRHKSLPVKNIEFVSSVVNDLAREIKLLKYGVGLSAIQIGIPKRIIVTRARPTINSDFIVLINPVLKDSWDKMVYAGEGCLSFPGQKVNTERFKGVHVVDDLRDVGRVFEGTLSVAIQHELDHLDGILLFDKAYHSPTIGRNDPCKCGSGKKFKKCCGR